MKATLLTNFLLVPFDFFIVFAATFLLGSLPNDAAKLAEVAKIATLLLTVEGILLGLSPLVFERRRGKSGPIFVTVAAFALLWSLVTIIVGDTVTNLTFMYPIYVIDLAFFQAVILGNVLSALEWAGRAISLVNSLTLTIYAEPDQTQGLTLMHRKPILETRDQHLSNSPKVVGDYDAFTMTFPCIQEWYWQ